MVKRHKKDVNINASDLVELKRIALEKEKKKLQKQLAEIEEQERKLAKGCSLDNVLEIFANEKWGENSGV